MLPRGVEAERLRGLEVGAQRVIARRGQQAVGKVTLVEDEALHERLAVQPDAAVRRPHAPQPEIAEDAVDDLAIAIEQRRLDVVERWRVGMPGSDRLQG